MRCYLFHRSERFLPGRVWVSAELASEAAGEMYFETCAMLRAGRRWDDEAGFVSWGVDPAWEAFILPRAEALRYPELAEAIRAWERRDDTDQQDYEAADAEADELEALGFAVIRETPEYQERLARAYKAVERLEAGELGSQELTGELQQILLPGDPLPRDLWWLS